MAEDSGDDEHEQNDDPVHRVLNEIGIDDAHIRLRNLLVILVTIQCRLWLDRSIGRVHGRPKAVRLLPLESEPDQKESDSRHENDGYPVGHVPSKDYLIVHLDPTTKL
jgi:hypothetical protein